MFNQLDFISEIQILKLNHLREFLRNLKSACIAYSGGVDSTLIATIAYEQLGKNSMAITGEFGGMGIEGAVKLGYRKELESIEDPNERKELFEKLVSKMYEVGQAIEAASFLEIDAVIDPAETRTIVLKAFKSALGNL